MFLRNCKETESSLVDQFYDERVPPETLDCSYHYAAIVGNTAWVKINGKWILGVVTSDNLCRYRDDRPERWFTVRYGRGTEEEFAPIYGDMKPDTPPVRAMLRKIGYDV